MSFNARGWGRWGAKQRSNACPGPESLPKWKPSTIESSAAYKRRQPTRLNRRISLPTPGFDDLEVDQHFVGGTHPAEIESGPPVEKSEAHDIQIEKDDQRPKRHTIEELL